MVEFDFKSYKFTYTVATLFALLAIPTFIQIASYVETEYFPVVENFEIRTSIETVAKHTILAGSYERKRQCELKNITWYVRDPDTDVPIAIPINRKVTPTNRPIGTYDFGPWELWMAKDLMDEDSYAVVLHDCHPIYLTRSVIYSKGTFR